MNFNEKIDLFKKRFSSNDFSVPQRNRKKILREVESNFITLPKDYYELNNTNNRFSNWWDNTNGSINEIKSSEIKTQLIEILNVNEVHWIACEFSNHILIYKASVHSIFELINYTKNNSNQFHIVQLKYEYMISLIVQDNKTIIKKCNKRN
ncbi:hypothetical protein ACPX19_06780 [Winogradskyella sp. HB-48]|uniref:hypothetical protein n=1 Tax=Winogradskyella sp. HB-48 TaxID=3416808 RepID=UPI003CF34137